MPLLAEIQIQTVSEFAHHVQELLPDTSSGPIERKLEGNWYRGVGLAASYKLTPSLLRHTTLKDVASLLRIERIMLEDFRRQSVFHQEGVNPNPEDADFKLLFMMQHYGVPTRLLDWSTNPFIALYFALSTAIIDKKKKKYTEAAAVWVLDPNAWNKTTFSSVAHDKGGPLTHGDARAKPYRPHTLDDGQLLPSALGNMKSSPAAIMGIANSARMFAQRGVFTVFGKDFSPMEDQYIAGAYPEKCLTKLIIPADNIAQMLVVLVRLGYTDSVSYPDLQGLAMEIRRSRGFGV